MDNSLAPLKVAVAALETFPWGNERKALGKCKNPLEGDLQEIALEDRRGIARGLWKSEVKAVTFAIQPDIGALKHVTVVVARRIELDREWKPVRVSVSRLASKQYFSSPHHFQLAETEGAEWEYKGMFPEREASWPP